VKVKAQLILFTSSFFAGERSYRHAAGSYGHRSGLRVNGMDSTTRGAGFRPKAVCLQKHSPVDKTASRLTGYSPDVQGKPGRPGAAIA
jgi:hypothetical protein